MAHKLYFPQIDLMVNVSENLVDMIFFPSSDTNPSIRSHIQRAAAKHYIEEEKKEGNNNFFESTSNSDFMSRDFGLTCFEKDKIQEERERIEYEIKIKWVNFIENKKEQIKTQIKKQIKTQDLTKDLDLIFSKKKYTVGHFRRLPLIDVFLTDIFINGKNKSIREKILEDFKSSKKDDKIKNNFCFFNEEIPNLNFYEKCEKHLEDEKELMETDKLFKFSFNKVIEIIGLFEINFEKIGNKIILTKTFDLWGLIDLVTEELCFREREKTEVLIRTCLSYIPFVKNINTIINFLELQLQEHKKKSDTLQKTFEGKLTKEQSIILSNLEHNGVAFLIYAIFINYFK